MDEYYAKAYGEEYTKLATQEEKLEFRENHVVRGGFDLPSSNDSKKPIALTDIGRGVSKEDEVRKSKKVQGPRQESHGRKLD